MAWKQIIAKYNQGVISLFWVFLIFEMKKATL